MKNSPIRIGIVGGGWRTSFFHNVASALPERFQIANMLVRSDTAAEKLTQTRGVRATTSLKAFLGETYDYVLVCVPREAAQTFVLELVSRDIPVLCETPLTSDNVEDLRTFHTKVGNNSPVQVAEQYPLQPHHAARIAVSRSGLLGAPRSAFLSAAHDYHAASLMRAHMGIGFESVVIRGRVIRDQLVKSLSPSGWAATSEQMIDERLVCTLEFPDRGINAVYDFQDQQYFSAVRSRHTSVRGEVGEIFDDRVRYLRGPGDPVSVQLDRRHTGLDGDLEGSFLSSISMGAETLYTNPYAPARMTDDEIAIAAVLDAMGNFVETGNNFYGIADASEDHYLSILWHQAARTGETVRSSPQPWSSAQSVFVK